MVNYKAFPAEFKADTEKRTFTGYASTFGNVDHGRDRVVRGAFQKTIQERGSRVKVLWQHNIGNPIGRSAQLSEDEKGLLVEAQVSDTTLGRDVMTLMTDGVIDQLSIGYDVIKDAWDRENDIRDLLELKLWEFSPVTFPMNDLAMITDVKHMSLTDIEHLARRAAFLADNGLKAGRVLSKRNLALVKQAYEALGSLIAAADDEDEPEKHSTRTATSKSGAADPEDAEEEPGDPTPNRADGDDPFAGIVKGIADLGGWARERKLVSELQDFGRSIRASERN